MENSEFKLKLGEHIKKLREGIGLSQVDLAYKCNFEKQNMRRIEAGGTNPTILTLKKIAEALEVPITKLLAFE